MAVIIKDVQIKPSPKYISQRLENCGIRSLNNLIDITNYLMLEFGHPCHVFDYDGIKTGKIVIRHAKIGEKITTLDNKLYKLNETDIVFDDGTGRLIDLPGIIGLKNSVVTDNTKTVIFWIETNFPKTIRNTAMRLGIRTLAASYNEKSPDPQASLLAFQTAIDLYQKISGGKISNPIYQIPENPQQLQTSKSINLDYSKFEKLIGIKIPDTEINQILTSLGFEIDDDKVIVPSWRINDVEIMEDLVEEVASPRHPIIKSAKH